MSAPLRTRALQNHYKQVYLERGHPNFWMVIDPNDITTWYVLVHNLGDENEGGEYIMRMTAPTNYPFGPPAFEFFTPNPRYEIGKSRPCVSMGEYHSDNYPATLGMYGFTCELIYSFFASDKEMGGGISMKTGTTKESKLKMAKDSKEYNQKHYPEVMALFDEERKRVFKNPQVIDIPLENEKVKVKKSEVESEVESEEKVEVTKGKKKSKDPKPVKSTKSTKPAKPIKSAKTKKVESSDEESSESSESESESEELKSVKVVKKSLKGLKF